MTTKKGNRGLLALKVHEITKKENNKMGCDIHMNIEFRYSTNNKWKTLIDDGGAYKDRNYNLFAILADVRNEGNIKPMFAYRGIPSDSPASGKAEYLGDHSFTYCTLEEIVNADWNQTFEEEGIINFDEFSKWNGKSEPFSCEITGYCKGVYGDRTRVLTAEEAKAGETGTHVKIKWSSSYRDAAGGHFWDLIDYLKSRCWQVKDYANIRLVFGFDS